MARLPKLKPDLRFEGRLTGRFRRFTGAVEIAVSAKAVTAGDGMALVRSSYEQIDSLERRAKAAAAKELLPVYDESWRVYETFEGGVSKVIEGPALNEFSFGNMLRLHTLEVTDPETFCLWFDSREVFGGLERPPQGLDRQ